MYLPTHVQQCITSLEGAGFAAYAVGGCVRDALLGLTPQDYDLCTNALPPEIQSVFSNFPQVLAGIKHGTVGVIFPEEVVEITTYRTEGYYTDSRHPDWVRFVPNIREDLARRDFTVNAMAYSPTRGFADPFGGQRDLRDGILRAVGDPTHRFQEDGLRILRGARFCTKYRLTPEPETLKAMIAQAPRMEQLARERVFDELCKLLLSAEPQDLRLFAPIVTQVIPELRDAVDFDQHSPYHAYDLYTHSALVTCAVPAELGLRWAALLHDVGKLSTFTLDETGRGHFYGHAPAGARLADEILRRLKAPNALRERVVTLIELHMTPIVPERKPLRRWLSRLGEPTLRQLLQLQQADMGGKGNPPKDQDFSRCHRIVDELLQEAACLTLKDLAINGNDLIALGFPPGKALGHCLQSLFQDVLEERMPNRRDELLAAAQEKRKELVL